MENKEFWFRLKHNNFSHKKILLLETKNNLLHNLIVYCEVTQQSFNDYKGLLRDDLSFGKKQTLHSINVSLKNGGYI